MAGFIPGMVVIVLFPTSLNPKNCIFISASVLIEKYYDFKKKWVGERSSGRNR
jgi:hypothetical protein